MVSRFALSRTDDDSWRRGNLHTRLKYLLDSGYEADCTFLLVDCKGMLERIRGHSLLLRQASPVLDTMLSKTWLDQEDQDIKIQDVSAESFNMMLRHVYTDHVDIPYMDSALKLLAAAHMYQLTDLLEGCVTYITGNLTPEKVCQVHAVVSTHNVDGLRSMKKLLSLARKCLLENTSAVMSAKSFLECSAATLRLILEEDSLSLSSELELVQACIRWGQQQLKKLEEENKAGLLTVRDALGDLVFLLRLRGLSSQDLAEHVARSGLLTDSEMNSLYTCVATNGEKPMPEKFTKKTRAQHESSSDKKRKNDAKHKVGSPEVKKLHASVEKGKLDAVTYLLEADVPVEGRKKKKGDTPLVLASRQGDVEMVQLLLEYGADVEAKGKLKATPLHCAACKGRTNVVKLLIQYGSKVNVIGTGRSTPLLDAVRKGHCATVRVLLQVGADHKVTNKKGDTPLHLAVKRGELDMVQALLSVGADPRVTNKKNQTSQLLAALKGSKNNDIKETIQKHVNPLP